MDGSARVGSNRFFPALIIIFSLFTASLAFGGDYHMGATLVCSDCHVMHYSLAHGYSGGAPGAMGQDGPFTFLLKDEVNSLCLNCHDGQSTAPDVYGANGNDYLREAGALTTGFAPYEAYKGHTLQFMTCISCHDPHGDPGAGHPTGSQHRNLKARPGFVSSNRFVTYATGTNDLSRDTFERDPALGQITVHYSQDNVDFNEPDTTGSAVSRWCQSCHNQFHGSGSNSNMRNQSMPAGTGWLRHPTADANIGAVGGGHSSLAAFNDATRPNRVKVMSSSGVWAQPYSSGITANCLSCHKAHGNRNSFGLIYMSGTGALAEEGDSSGTQAADLCRQCHVQ